MKGSEFTAVQLYWDDGQLTEDIALLLILDPIVLHHLDSDLLKPSFKRFRELRSRLLVAELG